MKKYIDPEIEILTVALEQGCASSFPVNEGESTQEMLAPGFRF